MSVRVTNQMMIASLVQNLGRLRARTASLTEQISSGNRIQRVSDDPSAGAEVMRVQSRLHLLEQWGSNLSDARTWLREAEAELAHMTDLLTRARELAISGANSTVGDSAQTALAPEVRQILDDLLASLNKQGTNGALFGGFQTDSAPFSIDMATGAVTYSGDSGAIKRDVGPGVTLTVNLRGDDFSETGTWDPADNLVTTVWQLVQDLENGTPADVGANLQKLEEAIDHVIALRAEIGLRDKRLEQVESQM